MQTSEVLNKAADLIQIEGWGQGSLTWTSKGSGLCLEGGIAAAMGWSMGGGAPAEGFQDCPAYMSVWNYLQDGTREKFLHLYAWNDAADRTAEEVVEVIRACALIEEARENAVVKTEVAA